MPSEIMEGPSELQCDCPASGTQPNLAPPKEEALSGARWEKLQRGLFGWATFLASRTGASLHVGQREGGRVS